MISLVISINEILFPRKIFIGRKNNFGERKVFSFFLLGKMENQPERVRGSCDKELVLLSQMWRLQKYSSLYTRCWRNKESITTYFLPGWHLISVTNITYLNSGSGMGWRELSVRTRSELKSHELNLEIRLLNANPLRLRLTTLFYIIQSRDLSLTFTALWSATK